MRMLSAKKAVLLTAAPRKRPGSCCPCSCRSSSPFPGWVFSDSRIHVVLCLSITHLQEAALEKGRGRRGHILYTFTAQPTPQYKVPEGMSTEEENCCPEDLPLKLSCREYKHILCCSLRIWLEKRCRQFQWSKIYCPSSEYVLSLSLTPTEHDFSSNQHGRAFYMDSTVLNSVKEQGKPRSA